MSESICNLIQFFKILKGLRIKSEEANKYYKFDFSAFHQNRGSLKQMMFMCTIFILLSSLTSFNSFLYRNAKRKQMDLEE